MESDRSEAVQSPAPIVELRDVSKQYGGNRALDEVSVRVSAGTVHALVGENGAGKSTLGKIIGGIVTPSEGTILVDGEETHFRSPRQGLAAGISVIQQEPQLVDSLSVAENVMLGAESTRFGAISKGQVQRRFADLLAIAPLNLDPDQEAGSLTIADQQKVEILRALARESRLIVMDEPTSSLGQQEAETLHGVIRHLCGQGRAVVYVSHFLDQVVEVADHFTVLRNGKLVETIDDDDEVSVPRLVKGMLGETIALDMPPKEPPGPQAPVRLSVRGVSREPAVRDVSLEVRSGEILGLAGLVGSGRTELARIIFGADRAAAGEIEIEGTLLPAGSPRAAIAAGVGFVPEDRGDQGLLLDLSQRVNVSLPHLAAFSRLGWPSREREARELTELLENLQVRPINLEAAVGELSGGNQQKVLFAKWLAGGPRVLILDEPTRGVDVGAKWAIYGLIASLAKQGIAILLISSETEELVGLAHRVLVMRRGQLAGEFEDQEVSMDSIMHAALGVEFESEGNEES